MKWGQPWGELWGQQIWPYFGTAPLVVDADRWIVKCYQSTKAASLTTQPPPNPGGQPFYQPAHVLQTTLDGTLIDDLTIDLLPRGSLDATGRIRISGDPPTLQTIALVSAFSDRLADPSDDIPQGDADRRGWWADSFSAVPIGSRLWTLARSKVVDTSAQQIEDIIRESLQWMLDDGIVDSIDVLVEQYSLGTFAGEFTLYRNAEPVVSVGWSDLWSVLNG